MSVVICTVSVFSDGCMNHTIIDGDDQGIFLSTDNLKGCFGVLLFGLFIGFVVVVAEQIMVKCRTPKDNATYRPAVTVRILF